MVEQACISDALKTKCLERQRSKTFVPDPIPWGWSATEPKLAKRLSSCQKPMIPTASCKVSDKLSYRTWLVSFDWTAKWHLDSGVSLFWGFGCPWYHPNLQVSKCPKYPDQPKHYPNLSEHRCVGELPSTHLQQSQVAPKLSDSDWLWKMSIATNDQGILDIRRCNTMQHRGGLNRRDSSIKERWSH